MTRRKLYRDNRAIEGLPIRLVIALVVGVASLAVMMNVISGLNTFGTTELDTKPEPEIIEEETTEVNVTVLDPDGQTISNATVIAKSDTATLKSTTYAKTGPDGVATLEIDPQLRPNQREGTVELAIRPPAGEYVDEQENNDILVLRP
ncbi:carboxypeptidase regulatory-like domain-containing protein [Halovenus rubra]|uniref:Carboxypeptidase regulatory-like domain-containing protein n=2 Tax=Halovenus rubra TaxID=869890 RepID=A0ACC7E488_9EURY|nr:carboxypeptidase regulatory-like domain-containing protein [Halovenus rubra]